MKTAEIAAIQTAQYSHFTKKKGQYFDRYHTSPQNSKPTLQLQLTRSLG